MTSFTSHLLFGWKKVIKVFPVLVNITQQWIPYIFLSVFILGEWDLERPGEPKKENKILDLKIKIHFLSQHPFSRALYGIKKNQVFTYLDKNVSNIWPLKKAYNCHPK